MAAVLARLAGIGLRRGVVEGSGPWLVVGVSAGMLALARRAVAQRPKTVYSAELKPGDRIEILALSPDR